MQSVRGDDRLKRRNVNARIWQLGAEQTFSRMSQRMSMLCVVF